ncbi:uncharacterized protein TRAVEDRAFT_24454 [Trametes versicolor FP-101664 SS1]|uniref:uncharacterized protein n=1 Tax=Trametes versicolor (strain FP-101664) TaxID=717944 RepID=UPI0004621AB9|nr:uncharacterized protein TRAVEDRAFT_24454 [Trametes versicolor FP-101664 SS1]EIW52144.1 hypothetical protein TRAVEDRAFT_24454 [Trametes versicolor FP-101664 SS1]
MPVPPSSRTTSSSPDEPTSLVYVTEPDEHGLYLVYPIRPQSIPDKPSLDALCETSSFPAANFPPSGPDVLPKAPSGLEKTMAADRPPYAPFPNFSTYSLFAWQNNDSNVKSNSEINGLAGGLLQHPDFRAADVANFNAAREGDRLDSYYEESETSPLSPRDGWIHSSVKIRVPKEGVCYASEEEAPEFVVDGLYHRSLVDVIDAAYRDPCVKDWHIIPSKQFWLRDGPSPVSQNGRGPSSSSGASDSSSDSDSDLSSSSSSADSDLENPLGGIRVYSEAYHADAIYEEDAAMRARPREAGDPDGLEYGIAPVGLWSDTTHLTQFSSAKLWPVYGYLLSQSKYIRGKPTAFAGHHIAYMPSLPDKFQDWYTRVFQIAATAAVLTFLKRELMQQIWLLLMDERFMYAYVHGLIIFCGDGIQRRMFIRFLLYAADYPEKIILSCLKYFARCPCPRCRINKDKIIEMGTMNDLNRRNWIRIDDKDLNARISLTRKWIFQDGMSLGSVYISRVLDPISATPTRSAFSTRLREHGFNFYSLFVPDLLHEFEIGVWKSIFTHILRLLHAVGEDRIQVFNKRFRQIPTFGRSTIRRFSSNVSDTGKLAARDYEARVKCIMPAIEGIMPLRQDNEIILDLCFDSGAWHAFGKLREHTEDTIDGLDIFTVEFGKSVRLFAKTTCARYVTVELPKEAAARGRRSAAIAGTTSIRKRKLFNCNTYKLHAMRDYPPSIRGHGSTDNNSTQIGELEHKHVKRFYTRTNKINFTFQIAQHARRAVKLQIIKARVDAVYTRKVASAAHADAANAPMAVDPAPPLVPSTHPSSAPLPYSSPADRYHVATSRRDSDEITAWLRAFPNDPALVDFVPKLKEHLLQRLLHLHSGDAEQPRVLIVNNRIFWHQVLRVNYTTYDRRRTQDSVNPRTHPDILLLAPSTETHKFWYARVIKIFHVNIHPMQAGKGGEPERLDVLFVRWFQLDNTAPGGFAKKRFHRLTFVPQDAAAQPADTDAFGFVDPADVVRGVHLIPAFLDGRTKDLLSPSLARGVVGRSDISGEEDTDFRFHYVNFFVDRDMVLRYYGDGIGHQGLRIPSVTAVADEDVPEPGPGTHAGGAVSRELETTRDVVMEEDAEDVIEDDAVPVPAEHEDDLLQLVPELAAGMAEALRREAQLFHDQREGEGDIRFDDDGLDGDPSDEDASDESGDDEEAAVIVDAQSVGDEQVVPDEYDIEGFAPL